MRTKIASLAALISIGSAAAFTPVTTPAAGVQLSMNAPRHDVRSAGAAREMDPEEMKIQMALSEHQQNAPKLGFDVDVRSLVEYCLDADRGEKERAELASRKHLNGLIFKFCGEAKTRLNLISTLLFDCTGQATSPSDWIRE